MFIRATRYILVCVMLFMTFIVVIFIHPVSLPNRAVFTKLNVFKQPQEHPSIQSVTNNKFNCSTVDQLEILKEVGRGTDHRGILANYQGRKVIVKILLKQPNAECLKFPFHQFYFKQLHTMERFQLLTSLCPSATRHMLLERAIYSTCITQSHRIIEGLGFCVRNFSNNVQGNLTEIVRSSSAISVFEYGTPLTGKHIMNMSYLQRLNLARELAGFVKTINKSCLGAVTMLDFGLKHIAIVNGHWKIFDLGEFMTGALPCRMNKINLVNKLVGKFDECPFNISCVENVCPGFGERLNNVILCAVLNDLRIGFIFKASICANLTSDDLISYFDMLDKSFRNGTLDIDHIPPPAKY